MILQTVSGYSFLVQRQKAFPTKSMVNWLEHQAVQRAPQWTAQGGADLLFCTEQPHL